MRTSTRFIQDKGNLGKTIRYDTTSWRKEECVCRWKAVVRLVGPLPRHACAASFEMKLTIPVDRYFFSMVQSAEVCGEGLTTKVKDLPSHDSEELYQSQGRFWWLAGAIGSFDLPWLACGGQALPDRYEAIRARARGGPCCLRISLSACRLRPMLTASRHQRASKTWARTGRTLRVTV